MAAHVDQFALIPVPYKHIRCYRILPAGWTCERKLLSRAEALGFRVEYRRDLADIFIPEGSSATLFLLEFGQYLLHVSYLDYHRSWSEAE